MTNTICQNHQLYKDFLSAHRQAYSLAKQGRKLEITLSFTPIILCLICYQLAKAMPNSTLALEDQLAVFALAGVCILLYCDLILDPIRKKHRRDANLDLEAYDTSVLELPWHESIAGKMKGLVDIKSEAADYQANLAKSHPPELSLSDSWYPEEVEKIALALARLYCLRQNCSFEVAYRVKYIQLFLQPMLAFTTILVITQAWVFGFSLSSICLILIVASPIFRIILLGILVQTANLKSMIKLKEDIDRARTDKTLTALAPGEGDNDRLRQTAREFQDRLFISRDTLPLISIGGFKYIKANYLPRLKAETTALLRQDGLL